MIDLLRTGPYHRLLPDDEAQLGDGPHEDPSECPTFYDGCNCHMAIYDAIYLELDPVDQVREGAD